MTFLTFKPESDEAKLLLEWWRGLEKDRGTRAELRRCASPEEAALVPSVTRLCLALGGTPWDLPKIGALAALAAHVTDHDEARSVPSAMASGQDRPAFPELRFRRLIQCQDVGELFTPMRRALALMDHRANLLDLAQSLWFWDHPSGRTRQEWTLSYYRHLPA